MGRRAVGIGGAALVILAGIWLGLMEGRPSAQTASRLPRTGGKPDFSGVWQAMNTANWNLQDHAARRGVIPALGAAFSVPGGRGIVDGNEIPYKPETLKQKQENGRNWLTADPEVKCFLPGTPRAMYMPYPFQIVQTSKHILMSFEFAGATRTVHMAYDRPLKPAEEPVPSWMGWSEGRWEGDTLVVSVDKFNDQSWFDRAGNFHSDELKVTERYTFADRNTIRYEATIEDPQVFTRPWKISMPIYRRLEKYPEISEYKCVEFVEDLMYGEFYKQPVDPFKPIQVP